MRRGFVDSLLLAVLFSTSACRSGEVRAAGSTAPPVGPPLRPSPDVHASPTTHPPAPPAAPANDAAPHPPATDVPAVAAPRDVPTEGFSIAVSAASRLEAVGATGSWIAVCTPSADGNDELGFSRLGGTRTNPERVDALLAASPSGRYVVLLNAGRTRLVDATTGHSLDLTPLAPSLEFDALPDHRSFAFAQDDRSLAVLEKGDRSLRLVPLGAATFDAPFDVTKTPAVALVEPAWRLEYQANQLVVQSPESGRPWPVQKRREAVRRCRDGAHFSAHSALSEPNANYKLQSYLLSSDRSRVELAPGFVFAVGSRWLRREADGRLVLVEGRVQKQVASSRCGARVLHSDAERQLFVVACEEYRPVPAPTEPRPASKKPTPPRLRFPLYLVGPNYVLDLEAETMRTGVDLPPGAPRRYVSLRPNAGAAWVDLERRQMIKQSADTFVLTESADGLLFKRGVRTFRLLAGREEALDLAPPALSTQLFRGEYFSLPGRAGSWLQGGSLTPLGSESIQLSASGVLVTRSSESETDVRFHVQVLPQASPRATSASSTSPPSTGSSSTGSSSTSPPSVERLTPPQDPPSRRP